MKHAPRFIVAAIVVTALVASCSGSDGGDPSDGGADSATDDAASDVTVDDTGSDAVAETGDDGGAADADSGNPDADADAGDADAGDADIADADAGDADVADADAGDADAGSVRFIVTSCTAQQGTQTRSFWIDSDGNRYMGPVGPGAGQAFPSPAPPGWPAPYGKLTPAELANLLAGAQTLDTSVAGTTTKIGPIYHQMTWTGYLRSGGRLGSSVFVDSLTDGVSYGKETIVLHNDPAANAVRTGRCFSVDH